MAARLLSALQALIGCIYQGLTLSARSKQHIMVNLGCGYNTKNQ